MSATTTLNGPPASVWAASASWNVPCAKQAGERVAARLLAAALEQERLLEREPGEAEHVRQAIACLGGVGRRVADGDAAELPCGGRDRQPRPFGGGRRALRPRGGLGSTDVDGARPDAGLGDDGVGDPLRDRGDLERPRELDRDGVHPPQLGDLGRHAPVQEAVLDGQPEPMRDRLQVGLVGRLEGHVGAADDEQHAERLVAAQQPRPRRVAAAVPAQPVRQRDLTGGTGHDGPRRGQSDVGVEGNGACGHVARPQAPVPDDREGVVGAEHEHRDVGGEELRDGHRRPLDDLVEVGGVPEDGDDLAEACRPREGQRRVALRGGEALAQRTILGLQPADLGGGAVRHHMQSRATLELWMPMEPVTRPNSPHV